MCHQQKQDGHSTYTRNIDERSCNHCCSGKAISITYSKYVSVALGTQHAKRVGHIVICGLSSSTIFFFCTLSHKRNDFRKEKSLNIKCFCDFLSNYRLKYLSF